MALVLAGKLGATALGTEYNDFLYAPLGEDENGHKISVLSALARLDIDPWERAEHLHRLSASAAVQELTALVAALPEGYSARAAPDRVATGLIALMPPRGSVAAVRLPPELAQMAQRAVPLTRWQIIIGYAFLILLSQWLFASMRPAAPQVAPGAAPAPAQGSEVAPFAGGAPVISAPEPRVLPADTAPSAQDAADSSPK
jgi:hypothetical protein